MKIEELLKSYVNNEQLNIEINDGDLKFLIEQSLQTLIYPVTQNKSSKKYYISWVLKQEQFFNLQEELTILFNSNNINHIYFKGSVLAKLYDDPSVRTRGDIDLYVNPNDLDKTKNLLIGNGFLLESNDCMHHLGFKKNSIEVEVHFNMFDSEMDKTWLKLFSNPFKLCEKKNDNYYEFIPTYHFIYCLMHFAHHLRRGAGLRYLLDFYYIFKKTTIDIELLHLLIKKCKLVTLYTNVINSLRTLFDIDFDNSIKNINVYFFIDYLKLYGIHGNVNHNDINNAYRHKSRVKYAIVRIFITDKNYRKARYPKLGSHWYLYPICLIVHWFYLITHKFGSFLKFLFGKNKNKKLFKQMGI